MKITVLIDNTPSDNKIFLQRKDYLFILKLHVEKFLLIQDLPARLLITRLVWVLIFQMLIY